MSGECLDELYINLEAMNLKERDKFTMLWKKYFGETELPLAGYYSATAGEAKVVPKPTGHSCLIAQLSAARKGKALCFRPESVNCGGGKRYLGFADRINERFACFLSNGEDGGFCERYKQSPDLVERLIGDIPRLPIAGENLIFKRWDMLDERDDPQFVVFFVNPDALAGLFTLARFDNNDADTVIAPFGAGCTSIVYYPYREYLENGKRAIIGMFDPSARKCVKANVLSFSLSIGRLWELMAEMEESFLITPTWTVIHKRLDIPLD